MVCRRGRLKLTIEVRREIRCVPVLHLGRAVLMVCSWFIGPACELVWALRRDVCRFRTFGVPSSEPFFIFDPLS